MTSFPLEQNVDAPNPYGSNDVGFIAKHAHAVLAAVMASDLPAGASILDMGSGWGLSSEVMAFCGAKVTPVDINPDFVELNRRRAARLGLTSMTPIHSAFDTFETDSRFDLILFYECLHHSVRPWETLARVAPFVNPGGKIAFAGEPINDAWPTWGLRRDPLSVYCIRKFGWFESGWSASFITRAFERAGFTLNLIPGIGLDGGLIGVATSMIPAVPATPLRATAPENLHAPSSDRTKELADRVSAMERSTSWRVTAPLRSMKTRIDAIFRS